MIPAMKQIDKEIESLTSQIVLLNSQEFLPPHRDSNLIFTNDPAKLEGTMHAVTLLPGPDNYGFKLVGTRNSGANFVQIHSAELGSRSVA